jgi:hypothetical protein
MLDTQLFLRPLCMSQKPEFIFKTGDVGVKRSRCYAVSLSFRVRVCGQHTSIPWVDFNYMWEGIPITFQNMLSTFQAPTSIPFRLMASSNRHTGYMIIWSCKEKPTWYTTCDNLYMFRAYLGPSGGITVCIQQLALIIIFRWLSVVLVGLAYLIMQWHGFPEV